VHLVGFICKIPSMTFFKLWLPNFSFVDWVIYLHLLPSRLLGSSWEEIWQQTEPKPYRMASTQVGHCPLSPDSFFQPSWLPGPPRLILIPYSHLLLCRPICRISWGFPTEIMCTFLCHSTWLLAFKFNIHWSVHRNMTQ